MTAPALHHDAAIAIAENITPEFVDSYLTACGVRTAFFDIERIALMWAADILGERTIDPLDAIMTCGRDNVATFAVFDLDTWSWPDVRDTAAA